MNKYKIGDVVRLAFVDKQLSKTSIDCKIRVILNNPKEEDQEIYLDIPKISIYDSAGDNLISFNGDCYFINGKLCGYFRDENREIVFSGEYQTTLQLL